MLVTASIYFCSRIVNLFCTLGMIVLLMESLGTYIPKAIEQSQTSYCRGVQTTAHRQDPAHRHFLSGPWVIHKSWHKNFFNNLTFLFIIIIFKFDSECIDECTGIMLFCLPIWLNLHFRFGMLARSCILKEGLQSRRYQRLDIKGNKTEQSLFRLRLDWAGMMRIAHNWK